MKPKYLLYFVICMVAIIGVLATTSTLKSPEAAPSGLAYYYNLDKDNQITFTCNGSPTTGQNITNVSLYLATPYNTGTFSVNATNSTLGDTDEFVSRNWVFTVAEATTFTWNCLACDNSSNCDFGDSNRTVIVEVPPDVNLHTPADNLWKTSNLTQKINFTAESNSTIHEYFSCWFYSNDTSLNWTKYALPLQAKNSTSFDFSYTFAGELVGVIWNIFCREIADPNVNAFASSNRTFNLDKTNPTGTISPSSGSYRTNGAISDFAVNATDSNLASCTLYGNFSGSWAAVETNSTTSGTEHTFTVVVVAGGNGTYIWNVWCNDSAANNLFLSTSNYSITVDTVTGGFDNLENVTGDYCDKIKINFTTTENSNVTLFYGNSSAMPITTKYYTFATSHTLLLDFGDEPETEYQYNFTYCDQADNCNNSDTYVVTTPVKLCTDGTQIGWSVYAILELSVLLGEVSNNSNADYTYFWNNTGQEWVYVQYGTTTNTDHELIYGDAVLLYETVNSTWFRVNSSNAYYNYSIKSGDNLIGLGWDWTFSELSVSMNVSFTSYAAYNNSDHEYYLHYNDTSWHNTTTISRGDVLWLWSNVNVTWNTTYIWA